MTLFQIVRKIFHRKLTVAKKRKQKKYYCSWEKMIIERISWSILNFQNFLDPNQWKSFILKNPECIVKVANFVQTKLPGYFFVTIFRTICSFWNYKVSGPSSYEILTIFFRHTLLIKIFKRWNRWFIWVSVWRWVRAGGRHQSVCRYQRMSGRQWLYHRWCLSQYPWQLWMRLSRR